MSRSTLLELVRRRVPHVTGIYLAAGWGLLEFTDWSVVRFGLPSHITDLVILGWLALLPLVVWGSWRLGEALRLTPPLPKSVPPASERQAGAARSVAVIPFANFSPAPEDEFLSHGLSDEIISALARIDGLSVVARTSTQAYRDSPRDVREIGRALGAQAVLEGSVQRAGSRLRVTTQLINVDDGYHLWSERFDRQMEDVFAIEDEIAENVARALRVILRDGERRTLGKVPTSDVRAYEFYLRGRQFFRQTRKKSLEFAREMFERAIEIDPDYAMAHAGLAHAASTLRMYYPGADPDLEQADRASRRALELDPELPEARSSRGLALFLMGRPDEAEEQFEAALELDPRHYWAHYFFGRALFPQGRFEEAARHFVEAASSEEDYQAAFFAAQSYEALSSEDAARHWYGRALEAASRHMELNPDDPRAATMRAVSLCRLGRPDQGLHWAERALAIDPGDAGVRYNVACLYALEGEVDEAVACLEEAVRVGFGNRDWIERDPDLDALRDDPRFQRLLAAMEET